jgi:hypothetical protein
VPDDVTSVLLNGMLVATTPVLGDAGGGAAFEHDASRATVTRASISEATAGGVDRRVLRFMNP